MLKAANKIVTAKIVEMETGSVVRCGTMGVHTGLCVALQGWLTSGNRRSLPRRLQPPTKYSTCARHTQVRPLHIACDSREGRLLLLELQRYVAKVHEIAYVVQWSSLENVSIEYTNLCIHRLSHQRSVHCCSLFIFLPRRTAQFGLSTRHFPFPKSGTTFEQILNLAEEENNELDETFFRDQ